MNNKRTILILIVLLLLAIGYGWWSRDAANRVQEIKASNAKNTWVDQASTTKKNAEKESCLTNQRMIEAAIQYYQVEQNIYPDDVNSLVKAGYLKSQPVCPEANQVYTIDASGKVVVPPSCHHGNAASNK